MKMKANEMNDFDFFKLYCRVHKLEHKYGIGCDENGTKSIKFLNGESSNYLEYGGRKLIDGSLYVVHPATCSEDSGCKVGKPKESCVIKGVYSKNKCAVYYFDVVDLNTFIYHLTYAQLKELNILIGSELEITL